MLPEDLGVVEDLSRWPVEVQIALSLAIIAVVLAVRWLATRLIRGGSDILTEQQRWRITAARNLSTALIFVGLFVVWSREIEEFALSITAFAVAFVIAGKELILCLSGAAWRGATSAFGIGDWVEIGPYSGEVIDETALATILQEIHPTEFVYTGRTVAVPNSMLLSQAVVNHNFRKR